MCDIMACLLLKYVEKFETEVNVNGNFMLILYSSKTRQITAILYVAGLRMILDRIHFNVFFVDFIIFVILSSRLLIEN